ncbi:MAG: hypothetical protein GX992_10360 [Clostridium sp.]|nr:hypothetical protein [Clostridium sp.]
MNHTADINTKLDSSFDPLLDRDRLAIKQYIDYIAIYCGQPDGVGHFWYD